MKPIEFLKAFFELGMVAWWVIGGILLVAGLALMYLGAKYMDATEIFIGFIIFFIGFLAVYYGTKLKNIEV